MPTNLRQISTELPALKGGRHTFIVVILVLKTVVPALTVPLLSSSESRREDREGFRFHARIDCGQVGYDRKTVCGMPPACPSIPKSRRSVVECLERRIRGLRICGRHGERCPEEQQPGRNHGQHF